MSEMPEGFESLEDSNPYVVEYPYVDTEGKPTDELVYAKFPDEISARKFMRDEHEQNPTLSYKLSGPTIKEALDE